MRHPRCYQCLCLNDLFLPKAVYGMFYVAMVFGLSHVSNEIDRSRDGKDLSQHLTVMRCDADVVGGGDDADGSHATDAAGHDWQW